MVATNQMLLTLLYALLCILVFVVILFVYKAIGMVDKTNELLDDIRLKVRKLDSFFDAIERGTDTINMLTSKVTDGVFGSIMRFFKRKDDFDE